MFDYKGARNLDAMYDFVTVGYNLAVTKSAMTDVIPPPPSMFDVKMKQFRLKIEAMTKDNDHLKYLLEDFEHIVSFRKNAAAALLVMGAIIGFFFGMILSLLLGLGSTGTTKGKKKKKKKKD